MTPQVLSAHETWKPLAVGGMSEVHLAARRNSDGTVERVVVKQLLPGMLEQERARTMFETEADLCLTLRHPNIVSGIERGLLDGRPYMVLEYVDGPDVAKLQARARAQGLAVDPAIAIEISLQTLRGLHHAHEACDGDGRKLGLVHRDISPENLFITRAGIVKVADFGIAKLAALETFTDPKMGLVGKLAFMAPERARGESFDSRADQYSVAISLYELLTGSRPYALKPGENLLDLAERVSDGKIAPLHQVTSLPRTVGDVVMRALKVRASDRWASCGEFGEALSYVAYRAHLSSGPDAVAQWIDELFPR